MKILYHHRTISKDGMDVHIQEMLTAFRARGHDVLVVGPAAQDAAEFGSDGGWMSRLRDYLPKALSELLEFAYSFVAYRNLRQAIQSFEPDILYERYNLFLLAGLWLKHRTGIPFIVEVNSPLFRERKEHGGLVLEKLARWSERSVWQGADFCLPVSYVLADELIASGVERSKIYVIPNGINRERFNKPGNADKVREHYRLTGRTILGFTGFVRPWHGLDRVIDFIARSTNHPDLALLIVGDGPIREDLEKRARALGLQDRVKITGVVPRDQIADHVSAFDIALQPDATDYASPLKLFEYLGLGLPIVAPDQPNIREILEHDRNALLFRPGSFSSLCNAIDRLLSEPDLRTRLGKTARDTIQDRGYTWNDNARRIEALAEKLGVNLHRSP